MSFVWLHNRQDIQSECVCAGEDERGVAERACQSMWGERYAPACITHPNTDDYFSQRIDDKSHVIMSGHVKPAWYFMFHYTAIKGQTKIKNY